MRAVEVSKIIQVPDDVEVTVEERRVTVKGTNGTLVRGFSHSPISIELDGKEIRVSHIIEGVCKGCGSCTSACPSGAIEQKGFKRLQILSMIDSAVE